MIEYNMKKHHFKKYQNLTIFNINRLIGIVADGTDADLFRYLKDLKDIKQKLEGMK
jgi:hypothetical protein